MTTRSFLKHLTALLIGKSLAWAPALWYINKLQEESLEHMREKYEEHLCKMHEIYSRYE